MGFKGSEGRVVLGVPDKDATIKPTTENILTNALQTKDLGFIVRLEDLNQLAVLVPDVQASI